MSTPAPKIVFQRVYDLENAYDAYHNGEYLGRVFRFTNGDTAQGKPGHWYSGKPGKGRVTDTSRIAVARQLLTAKISL